jgi:hypothetical protein
MLPICHRRPILLTLNRQIQTPLSIETTSVYRICLQHRLTAAEIHLYHVHLSKIDKEYFGSLDPPSRTCRSTGRLHVPADIQSTVSQTEPSLSINKAIVLKNGYFIFQGGPTCAQSRNYSLSSSTCRIPASQVPVTT